MKIEEIEERVIGVLRDMTDEVTISAESAIMEDLGLGSIEVYDMLVELEVEFGISIPERLLSDIYTVRDMAEAIADILNA